VAFETTENLRHVAFFTELAALEDADLSWRSVTAGLVVLRLVDAWIEEGASVVSADSWGVRSVRAAVEDMPEGLPARALLGGVVDALTSSRGGDLHAVAPRLMAYAKSLDLDAKWALAADVYETILAHVHPVEDADVAVNALLRRAYCLRQLGDLSAASTVYATAAEVASRSGDMIGTLRARIGEAKVMTAKGNLPAADALLEQAVAQADVHELTEVRSMATHDRSSIAHMRGQYDVAVRLAYDAMRDSVVESERDRILGDLAGSFYMLGVKSAARDAFMILAATAREQYQRWAATINLMELAAEDGVSIQFERYRQQLAAAKLPPLLRSQFELHVGRGYQTFGELGAARTWLERALQTASEHSFNQLVFAAESALANNAPKAASPVTATTYEVADDVNEIAVHLREMRELAGV
jgi:tetratricopeptide (TPR) repeat protein